MMDILVSRDTVTIDESVHYIYKELTDGTDPVTVPFKTMKDVFLWAASLGYKRGERRPIAGKKLTIFRWAQFSSQTDIPVVKAISLADGNDINVLLNQDGMLNVVEEFANAGIHDLRSRLVDEHGQPLWNLVGVCDLE
jgi:dnd system-associated protein 4